MSEGRPTTGDRSTAVETFSRSPGTVFMNAIAAPIGGLAFLGFAVYAFLFGGLTGIVGGVVLAFFGVLMIRGGAASLQGGLRLAAVEVGPAGIWMSGMRARLPWSDIAEVRLEAFRSVAGRRGRSVKPYRRLGVQPRSDDVARQAPGGGAMAMAGAYMRLVNTMNPALHLSDPTRLAPYGVYARELVQDFDDLIRSVERFAPVKVDTDPG